MQLVSEGMWILVVLLVGYERMVIDWGYERRWIKWFAISTVSIFIKDYYLQYTNFLILSDKESVIVSPVITVHT